MKKYVRTLALISMILLVAVEITSQSVFAVEDLNVTPRSSCTIPGEITRTRPNADGPPTKVKFAIILLDLIDINETNETFDIDFIMAMQWQDERLSKHALGSSLEDCRIRLNSIWHPEILMFGQGLTFHLDPEQDVDIDEHGVVGVKKRITGTFVSSLQLQYFPFDEQRLKIRVASSEYSSNDLMFILDKTIITKRENIESPAGWEILSNAHEILPDAKLEGFGSYARINQTISVKRLFGFWLWTLVVPLTLIVLMAWSVFWLDPHVFFPQITIGVTSVFKLIAFKLSLRDSLPQI